RRRAGRLLRRADERAAAAPRLLPAQRRPLDRGAELQREPERAGDARPLFGARRRRAAAAGAAVVLRPRHCRADGRDHRTAPRAHEATPCHAIRHRRPRMKIMIVSDAWEPQINGVVRTLGMTAQELRAMGHEVQFLAPDGFRSLPCPTYPEIRLALASRGAVA